ncbi:dbp [Peridroma alphabaculovirus]|uniref:Dbp n=1 Tax=Peridroma alphabaculovirus TaxID=1346829 RepID=A0A068LKN1_9ABAC|nr:dbp [Peridroma alphabaculovirus]AIE47852.1 dbp [Peridroma alphabaculovirus]
MASKRAHVADDDSVALESDPKRPRINDNDDDNDSKANVKQDLAVYNGGGSVVASADEDDEVEHPDGNQMLCVFKTPTITRELTWTDKLRYNLDAKNLTVLRCDTAFNKLFDALAFLRESMSIDQCIDEILPKPSNDIIILKPKSTGVVYQVGKQIKGGIMPFYFFDFVKIRRARGQFGEYLSMRWPKQYMHNEAMSSIIRAYKHWGCQIMKMQNVVYSNLPGPEAYTNKMSFVRKFFDIKPEHNQRVFMTGQLCKSVVCEPFTVERFDKLFKIEPEGKVPSEEVEMLVGVQIEGFKISKNDVEYATIDNSSVQDKNYSLAVKPMVFFHIAQ